ncbi:TetR family transcriptional regulator [Jeotgalibacillus soli]|uniref:TetR family transcriptional regulator n=1 Tax=Jeotgalibacillus soli TaxID=889306 RepID=A0A0C2VKY1_9BACL|nr:TetR family transcriptional regulator [Jeotgalibacillus soli]
MDVTKGKNHGLNEGVILQFIVTSYVGIVEWWFKNGMLYPPHVMAEQAGILLEESIVFSKKKILRHNSRKQKMG